MTRALQLLLEHDEPSIRARALSQIVGEPTSARTSIAANAVVGSPRVQALLSERDSAGRIARHPYHKWLGAHWVLATLADLGYPPGDSGLVPLREQVYDWLLSASHKRGIRTIDGRARRCASQEGNALYSLLTLGIADERCDELALRLRGWQWPDGGWNCDKNRTASNSSFMESLIPLRALALHARETGNRESADSARRAADIFLKRKLFRTQRDGQPISEHFVRLHYPCYWHYDYLFGLKVLAEAGQVGDARCRDALDLLETERLADGTFPAHAKYYRCTPSTPSGRSLVDWGSVGGGKSNPWVTLDALTVLRAAGRAVAA